jgi:hypothetical protein
VWNTLKYCFFCAPVRISNNITSGNYEISLLYQGLRISIIIIIIIARCASAANVVCRDVDVFGARNVLLSRLLYYGIILTIKN